MAKLNILLFESLLQYAREEGFSIGVDTHIHIHTLMNHMSAEEGKDLFKLKIQLGTIIAKSPSEQYHFYKLFDLYIERFTRIEDFT